MNRTLTVQLATDVSYLTGTVNGVECTWQMVSAGTWQTTAARAENDIYALELQAVKTTGQAYQLSTTIYYGLHLITDRTKADVDRLEALMTKGWDKLTEAERQEYLGVSHKGAYNASDLNRVGAAVNYVAELLTEWGYPYAPNMRTDWTAADYSYAADLREYLAAVEGLRERLAVFENTPNTPDWVGDHQQANDIEKIIEDVHLLLQNMIAELPYADMIYSGAYPL